MNAKNKDKPNFKKKILKPRRRIGTGCFEVQPQDKFSTNDSRNVVNKLNNSQEKAF